MKSINNSTYLNIIRLLQKIYIQNTEYIQNIYRIYCRIRLG